MVLPLCSFLEARAVSFWPTLYYTTIFFQSSYPPRNSLFVFRKCLWNSSISIPASSSTTIRTNYCIAADRGNCARASTASATDTSSTIIWCAAPACRLTHCPFKIATQTGIEFFAGLAGSRRSALRVSHSLTVRIQTGVGNEQASNHRDDSGIMPPVSAQVWSGCFC